MRLARREIDEHFESLDPDHLTEERDDNVAIRIAQLPAETRPLTESIDIRDIVDDALRRSQGLGMVRNVLRNSDHARRIADER